MKIISVRYSTDADSLPVRMGKRMVVLLVGKVGKCCGRPKCLRTWMGRRLNPTCLKARIQKLTMKGKNVL